MIEDISTFFTKNKHITQDKQNEESSLKIINNIYMIKDFDISIYI